MTLTIFQDKPLSGFLVGITMMKILRKEISIPRRIRRKINAVKLGFLIFKSFGKDFSDVNLEKGLADVNFMWKDSDDKNSHLHFFPQNDQIGIGMVVTDETKSSSEKHFPVDNKKFFEVFGREVDDYFKNEQEILDISTSRFDKSRIISYSPNVVTDKVKGKMLYLKLEENEKELSIQEFKNTEEVLGINITKEGKAEYLVIKKDNKIHCYGYPALKKIAIELFPILGVNYKSHEETI